MVLSVSTSAVADEDNNLFEAKAQVDPNNSQVNSMDSNDQIYYDLFITMLYPYVEEEIVNYYDEYMTTLPGGAPYSYEFTSIKKTPGLNYSFILELEIQPYIGPHLSVGRDSITFKIDLEGVRVEKFEHIESYEFPPHYQNVLKKKLPNTKPSVSTEDNGF